MELKTVRTVCPITHRVSYAYTREKANSHSKAFYYSNERYGEAKRRRTFLKNVKDMRIPIDRSLQIYRPSEKELREIQENILQNSPVDEAAVFQYFKSIDDRMLGFFPVCV
jgi:hypothetical protein